MRDDEYQHDAIADVLSPDVGGNKGPEAEGRKLYLKANLPIIWARGKRRAEEDDDDFDAELQEITWHLRLDDSAAAFLAAQALNNPERHHDENVS